MIEKGSWTRKEVPDNGPKTGAADESAVKKRIGKDKGILTDPLGEDSEKFLSDQGDLGPIPTPRGERDGSGKMTGKNFDLTKGGDLCHFF